MKNNQLLYTIAWTIEMQTEFMKASIRAHKQVIAEYNQFLKVFNNLISMENIK